MRLNSVEWANAQMILTKLAQALAMLAKPEGAECGFSFKERLFVPPSRKEVRPFSRETRILTELQAAQKEMSDLIEKIPEEKASLLQRKDAPQEKGKSSPLIPKETASFGQAKVLIVQVRGAIQKLSSSSNLSDPESHLLRKEIERLKPLLDALVETVSREKPKEIARAAFRLALPIPLKRPLFSAFRFSMPASSPETQAPAKLPALFPQEANFNPRAKSQEIPPLHSEPKTIGSIPLNPELRRGLQGKKKREKKKSFWFRADRENAEDPLP
ncbi:MAG: hypothetical protein A3E80_00410 [Chlamydiae bacterium RIFCSPHIGHO2_12_FULL_49_9]|nr:MAG: hypothetical protein A3E80_00410 [Chlamydiae bacterium RIFCSPHIGHO2_12_FULL_49_9]